MNIKTSIDIIEAYSARMNLPIVDAITKLSNDIMEDYIHTLPGAPKGYQLKVTDAEEQALRTFSKYRRDWVLQAKTLGLDLSDFTDVEAH